MQKTLILLMHCKEMEKQQKTENCVSDSGMECRMLTGKRREGRIRSSVLHVSCGSRKA